MSDEIRELTNEETESIVGGARGSDDEPCTEHKVLQRNFPVNGKCTGEFNNCRHYSKSTKGNKSSESTKGNKTTGRTTGGAMHLEKCNLKGWENFSRVL